MSHRISAALFLSVLIAATLPSSVHAQTDPVDKLLKSEGWSVADDLSDDALRLVLYEIALLRQLDAFSVDNAGQFDRIHAAFGEWPDTSRSQVFELLKAIDAELAERLSVVELLPESADSDLFFAVGPLPTDWSLRILAGETEFITGNEYVHALQALLADDPTETVGPTDTTPSVLQARLDEALRRLADAEQLNVLLNTKVDQLRLAVDELSTDRISAPSRINWLLIATGAATAGMLLGVSTMAVRRRRAAKLSGTAEVIEAHRSLTAARSESEVAATTARVAGLLADGADAALLRRVPEGLRIAGTTAIITDTAVSRIIETGQPLFTTLLDDPIWPSSSVAIAGVPVVHEGLIIGAVVVWREADRPFDESVRDRLELLVPAVGGSLINADELDSMETMAMVDGLTSLGNRRRLDDDLETVLATALATNQSVGFAMIDVDHFKVYNDTNGHSAGDDALRAVADALAACVRENDVVYRYGGEEFSILLPGSTPEEAFGVAERVRCSIERLELPGEHLQPGGRLTVSVGIATLDTGPPSNLKERADAALYRAKANGRNQVALD